MTPPCVLQLTNLQKFTCRFLNVLNKMEEVDSIIIHQLREIGCDFDETVTSLKELDADAVFQATLKCLSAIQSDNSLPSVKLHSNTNMATKYKLATECANLCQDIGFKGDVGYQTFLYGSDAELRKLFLFLIEKLPKDEIHGLSPDAVAQNSIVSRIKKIPVSLSWLPAMDSHEENDVYLWDTLPANVITSDLLEGSTNFKPLEEIIRYKKRVESPPEKVQSLENRLDIEESENVVDESSTLVSEEKTRKLELVLKDLDQKLHDLSEELNSLEVAKRNLDEEFAMQSEAIENEKSKLMKMQASNKTTSELRDEIEVIKAEIMTIGSKWESISSPIVNSLVEIKRQHKMKSYKTDTLNKELNEVRKTINNMVKNIKSKEIAIEELKEKLSEPLPPNRALYTRRIMEIVGNVKKQNQETKKVLLETRQLQKEINSLSGKVQRSFTIADETIFKDAKNSEWNRKCYKLLATLHEDYDQLLEGINTIGTIKREVLQLDEMVENERGNKVVSNLTRIQADLNQMKLENQQIIAKYQSLQSR